MDFVGSLLISSELALSGLAEHVGTVLDLHFQPDDSGRYEEYPAYVAVVLGFEIALLRTRVANKSETEQGDHDYQLLVQTFHDAADEGPEVDVSSHLQFLLAAAGIESRLEPAAAID